MPFFSIITVVKDERARFEKTLRCVTDQRERDFEYIVIDGASTDGTCEVLNVHQADIDVCVSEPDRGISDAFNKGVSRAKGEWVVFLNAGDVFVDDDVLRDVKRIIAETKDDISVVTGYVENKEHKFRYPRTVRSNDEPLYLKALIAHQATFVRRDAFVRHGSFDLSLPIAMDYDFFLRMFRKERFLFVPKPWVYFDVVGVSSRSYFTTTAYTVKAQLKNAVGFREHAQSAWWVVYDFVLRVWQFAGKSFR